MMKPGWSDLPCCTRYSPLVTLDPPAGVFIDIAGSAHLFKGEVALVQDLKKRLAESRFATRAAVAIRRDALGRWRGSRTMK